MASSIDLTRINALPETPLDASVATDTPIIRKSGLRHALANVCMALLFFVALFPAVNSTFSANAHIDWTLANTIWIAGTLLMGVLSLIRVPPHAATINVSSVMATAGMMLTPALMRPQVHSEGTIAKCAVVVESVGIIFDQVSRVYLGRRFGLLPANRGIVTTGPFRLIRHPIYLGWFVLTIGYVMAYPTMLNATMTAVCLPFMMWRITLEEELLTQDPAYRAYCKNTPHRLIPGIF